jgi:hypothetical protein
METKASLNSAVDQLPPMSKFILKCMIGVGAISLAYKLGFFSWAGFTTICGILAVFAMIFFALCNVEQDTRDTFYSNYERVKQWFLTSLAESVKEAKPA